MPRNAAPPDLERQLMIKTKTCQRMLKEVAYYKKEVSENEAILATMKAEGKDPYDIKRFENVLGESYMMVPDSESRLQQALEDLNTFIAQSKLDESGVWFVSAQDILKAESKATEKEATATTTSVDNIPDGEVF